MATAQFLNAATSNAFATTLDGNVALGDTTILLTTVTGLQAPGILCIDRTNGTTATPNQREYISYTGISTRTLTGVTRGLGGSTAQPHNSGALVEENMSIDHWNDLIASLSVEHNSAGTHKTALVTTLKASAAEVATGTDDTKIVTPKGIKDATGITLTSPVIRAYDGWIDANETWTYASASTITVPSGAASKYEVGDRIKWTQTTVKYGVIVAVADTLLTIAVNTDYVVTNAAITLNYYSHEASPIGYPQSFTYTPAFTGITLGNSTNIFKYSITGKMVHVQAVFTLGSSEASITGLIGFGLPVASINALDCSWFGLIGDSGVIISAALKLSTSTRIDVYALNAAGTYLAYTATSSTAPMTWAYPDYIIFNMTYNI